MKQKRMLFNSWLVNHIKPGVIISTFVSFVMFRFAASFQDNIVTGIIGKNEGQSLEDLQVGSVRIGKFIRDVLLLTMTCILIIVFGHVIFHDRRITSDSVNVSFE